MRQITSAPLAVAYLLAAVLALAPRSLALQAPSSGALPFAARHAASWPGAPGTPPRAFALPAATYPASSPLQTAAVPAGDLLFVAASIGGPEDPAWLFDIERDRKLWSDAQAETNNVTGGAFADGGTELFLAGGDTNGGTVTRADLTGFHPSWSVVYDPLGSGPFDVHVDEARRLLYVLAHPLPGPESALLAIDIDPDHPTYLQVVATTHNLTVNPIVERFALSASGNRAAVLSALMRQLHVVDTDPASPTYMRVLFQGPVPVSGPFPVVTSAVVTSDDGQVIVSIQRGGGMPSSLGRFDLSSSSWIDHNPALPGIQNIGPDSAPAADLGAAVFDVDIAGDDTFAVACGWGGAGWAGRLDLDPAVPSLWMWTAYAPGVGLTDAWALDLASDDQLLAIETERRVLLLHPGTGAVVHSFPLALATNIYLVRQG
ncbi:MAG: hypothetical protein CMJ84_10850 [Planctomycetes bacterium]|jgi:hypothetical protein|nr:hypothetical protein [Planctomycetota bacterium]MDP6408789.1 hypothetical protein [Planctomycetota bacterium]